MGPDAHFQRRVPGRGLSPAKEKTSVCGDRQGRRKQRPRFPPRELEAMRRPTGSERVAPVLIPSHGRGKWLGRRRSKCQDTMGDPGTRLWGVKSDVKLSSTNKDINNNRNREIGVCLLG